MESQAGLEPAAYTVQRSVSLYQLSYCDRVAEQFPAPRVNTKTKPKRCGLWI